MLVFSLTQKGYTEVKEYIELPLELPEVFGRYKRQIDFDSWSGRGKNYQNFMPLNKERCEKGEKAAVTAADRNSSKSGEAEHSLAQSTGIEGWNSWMELIDTQH